MFDQQFTVPEQNTCATSQSLSRLKKKQIHILEGKISSFFRRSTLWKKSAKTVCKNLDIKSSPFFSILRSYIIHRYFQILPVFSRGINSKFRVKESKLPLVIPFLSGKSTLSKDRGKIKSRMIWKPEILLGFIQPEEPNMWHAVKLLFKKK